MDIQYEGTNYVGWQKQDNGNSVQSEIEKCLCEITQENINVLASGRTDAGVHAHHQVISFDSNLSKKAFSSLIEGTNALLPKDIRVLSFQKVDDAFHPIQNVKEKTYRYMFYYGDQHNVFAQKYSHHIYGKLNIDKMKKASQGFVGEHDFKNYRNGEDVTKSSVRSIYKIEWGNLSEQLHYVDLVGKGFLRNMVRNIVGVLLDVALDKLTEKDIQNSLKSTCVNKIGFTAPAKGLFLWNVQY